MLKSGLSYIPCYLLFQDRVMSNFKIIVVDTFLFFFCNIVLQKLWERKVNIFDR